MKNLTGVLITVLLVLTIGGQAFAELKVKTVASDEGKPAGDEGALCNGNSHGRGRGHGQPDRDAEGEPQAGFSTLGSTSGRRIWRN